MLLLPPRHTALRVMRQRGHGTPSGGRGPHGQSASLTPDTARERGGHAHWIMPIVSRTCDRYGALQVSNGLAHGASRYGECASGLNLVVAAITMWNTVYLERVVTALMQHDRIDESLLPHVSPLGWNHIGLTGDYSWHANKRVAKGGFRPLRRPKPVESVNFEP